jgi:hypothetical protein
MFIFAYITSTLQVYNKRKDNTVNVVLRDVVCTLHQGVLYIHSLIRV